MRNPKANMQEMLQALLLQHQHNEKWSTASLYRYTLNSLNNYAGGKVLPFKAVTPEWLKSFESYLRANGCKWNTVSTYIRVLRTAYNRAVEYGIAPYKPYLFNKVYVGVETDKENALDVEVMARLITISKQGSELLTPADLKYLRIFVLLFYLRGLPFVDFAFMKKSELRGNIISYRRRKTGCHLTVEIIKPAAELIRQFVNHDPASPYLFPIIHHPDGSEEAFNEYRHAIRYFNKRLSSISQKLNLNQRLSSYTARHTWATMAFYCEISPGIISQAMGHSSIKITETYLKPFQNRVIHQANRQVISYVLGVDEL